MLVSLVTKEKVLYNNEVFWANGCRDTMINYEQYETKDGITMALLQTWRDVAYSQETDKKQLQQFWSDYFLTEKGIYEQLLENPD